MICLHRVEQYNVAPGIRVSVDVLFATRDCALGVSPVTSYSGVKTKPIKNWQPCSLRGIFTGYINKGTRSKDTLHLTHISSIRCATQETTDRHKWGAWASEPGLAH